MEALRTSHSVATNVEDSIAQSKELAEYTSKGGFIFSHQRLNKLTSRMASKGVYSRFSKMERWKPDVLVLSGGPADCLSQPDLMVFLAKHTAPQVFIIQANAEGSINGDEQRGALRRMYREASGFIFVSEANARLLERQLTMDLPNTAILPGPLRLSLEKPLPWPDNGSGEVRFATVARYDAWCKCQDQTLEAFAAPEWKKRDWRLSLYGSGGDEVYFAELIRYYGLEKHVTIQGYERDFRKIWAEHHIHVLNSRIEGLTLALLESMFCGRPAVITRAGGNHDLMRDGVDGFVSPGLDPTIIRETLERAWAKRAVWATMGGSAHLRAREWIPIDLPARFLKKILDAGHDQSLAKARK
jgi:glycosyltransferase involved in cell wall biosynthesis